MGKYTEYAEKQVKENKDAVAFYGEALDKLNTCKAKEDIEALADDMFQCWIVKKVKAAATFDEAMNISRDHLYNQLAFYSKELTEATDKIIKMPQVATKIYEALEGAEMIDGDIIVKTDGDRHSKMFDIAQLLVEKLGIESAGTCLTSRSSWTTLNARLNGIGINICSTSMEGAVLLTVKPYA